MINLSVCVSYEGMRNKVLVYLNIYILVKRKLNENNDLWNMNEACLFACVKEVISMKYNFKCNWNIEVHFKI